MLVIHSHEVELLKSVLQRRATSYSTIYCEINECSTKICQSNRKIDVAGYLCDGSCAYIWFWRFSIHVVPPLWFNVSMPHYMVIEKSLHIIKSFCSHRWQKGSLWQMVRVREPRPTLQLSRIIQLRRKKLALSRPATGFFQRLALQTFWQSHCILRSIKSTTYHRCKVRKV